jgi:hypothetical protein
LIFLKLPNIHLSIAPNNNRQKGGMNRLFVLCMLAALFMQLRLAHGWVNFLSDAQIESSRVWVEGLIWSIVLGWLIALVFGTIYSSTVARRALQEMS